MKKYQYLGVICILLFSFFYAEKIADLTLKKNKVYQSIENNKENYRIESVSAIIDGDYIIPGLYGAEVNTKKSYYKMKKLNSFNSKYLVYTWIIPKDSIKDNINKIIIRGNKYKNQVAIIVNNNDAAIKYLLSNNIKVSILVNYNNYSNYKNVELINNDTNNYNKMENILNKMHHNTNICYLNEKIEDICRRNKKYLVKSNLIVNNQSFINIKNNITNGDIYYLESNLKVENLELLINSIKFKDLDMVYVSELISEERY